MGHAGDRYALGNALPRRRRRAWIAVALLTGWFVVGLATAGVGLAAKAGDGAANGGGAVPVAGESVNERLTRMELEIRQLREEQATKTELSKIIDEKNSKILETYNNLISNVTERISGIESHLTIASIILGLAGVLTYINIGNKAKQSTEEWIHLKQNDLQKYIDDLLSHSIDKIKNFECEAESTIESIRMWRVEFEDEKNKLAARLTEQNIDSVKNDLEEKLDKAVAIIKQKSQQSLTPTDWWIKAYELYKGKMYNESADSWLKCINNPDSTKKQILTSLINRATCFNKMNKHKEALEIYTAGIDQFESNQEATIMVHVAQAMFNKGVTLGKLKRPQEQLDAYDAVITRFDNETEPGIRKLVAMAMVNRGVTLGQLKGPQEQLDAYDAVITRFGNETEPGIRDEVAKAFSNMSFTLFGLHEYDKALNASEEALRRFRESNKNAFSESIAIAMGNRSAALVRLGRASEALTGCNEILTHYKQSPESFDWLVPFAEAMGTKADALDALERHDEAQTTCDAMVAEFGKSDDADVLEEVTKGLREAAERARARNDATRLAHYEETLKKLPQPD